MPCSPPPSPKSIFLERTDSRIPLVREVYSLEDRELLYTSLGKGYVDAIAAHETAVRTVYEGL